MPHNKEFAARLKQLRTACGLTQKAVAQVLGIDRSTYTYYETGKTHPDLDTLARLAGMLRVSADELLGLSAPAAALHDIPSALIDGAVHRFAELTADEQILLLQYRQLTDDQRAAVVREMQKKLNDTP